MVVLTNRIRSLSNGYIVPDAMTGVSLRRREVRTPMLPLPSCTGDLDGSGYPLG